MSVKSIDTQIMMARTADFSRDTSAMQKKPEAAQEYLAVHKKINDAQEQTRVAKTPESRLSKMRNDEGGGGGGSFGGGSASGAKKDAKDEKTGMGMFVPADDSIIDIKV